MMWFPSHWLGGRGQTQKNGHRVILENQAPDEVQMLCSTTGIPMGILENQSPDDATKKKTKILPAKRRRNLLTIVGFAVVIALQILLASQVVYSNNSTAREMQKMSEDIKELKRENDVLRGEREKLEAEKP